MAQVALSGHPFLIYSVNAGNWRSDNGPLSLVPLSLVVALVSAMKAQGDVALRAEIAVAGFSVFTLLMAREGVVAIRAAGGQFARPWLAWAALLMSPPLWIGLAHYGHLELAMALWFVLLAMRLLLRGKPGWGGLCLGLAVLTHTTAALVAIPMVLLPLMSGRIRTAVTLAGAASATVIAGLLPFVLADARDVVQSFITYRAAQPTLGGSFWLAVLGVTGGGFVQHWDSVFWAPPPWPSSALPSGSGRPAPFRRARDYGLLAVATACLPLLAKSVWPYYLVDPCVLPPSGGSGDPQGVLNWRLLPPALLAGAGVALALRPPPRDLRS